MLDRRSFVKSAALTAAAAFAPSLRATPVKPPNVLFVLADQWRHQAFTHAGDPNIRTPHFDKLAGQGSRWNRCYAANPVCTPNRSCILTGRFSHQHGMVHNDLMLPPGERCIAEVFSDAGYATQYIGKWHMDGHDQPGFVPPGWRRRGFQTFEGVNQGHVYFPPTSLYYASDGRVVMNTVYEPTAQTDLAMSFMKKQKEAGKPFYTYLSWGPPHAPHSPPKEFDRFDPDKLTWRPNVPDSYRADKKGGRSLCGYYGQCESLDHEMGRLIKFLDDEGLADNTLLVFTSDHGDMEGSHGYIGKSKPEDESLHVPLFMRWPGRIKPGLQPQTLMSSIDLTPTILTACGLKPPSTVTGTDKSSAALTGSDINVESIYAGGSMSGKGRKDKPNKTAKKKGKAAACGGDKGENVPEWRCLVTPTHKIIRRLPTGGIADIYDLEKDPYEMTNLFGKREHAALQSHLEGLMARWAKDTGDPYPEASPAAAALYSDEEAAKARS